MLSEENAFKSEPSGLINNCPAIHKTGSYKSSAEELWKPDLIVVLNSNKLKEVLKVKFMIY